MSAEVHALTLLLIASLFALLLALVGAPLIVARFRRRVTESMERASPGAVDSDDVPAQTVTLESGAVPLPRIRAASELDPTAEMARADQRVRHIAAGYALGGVAHALIMTAFVLWAYAPDGTSAGIALSFLLVFLVPLAPMLGFLLTARAGTTAMSALAACGAAWILAGPARELLTIVAALHLLLPAVLFGMLQLRYWRAAAPLLLPLGFVVGLGWMLGQRSALALDLHGWIWGFRLAGAAVGLWAARGLIRRMARDYRLKRASDQEIFLDSWWAFYTLVQALILMVKAGPPMLLCGSAFFAFRWIRRRYLAPLDTRARPRTLLLLRVFGHGARTERLLDALTLRWRAIGIVELIAGADVAARNLDPHELHAFLGGTLAREFVRDDTDLAMRLQSLDRTPDPDGRYRITQLYCHRDTWQRAVDRLMHDCDAVLMDLRSLTRERAGCRFELARLATHRGSKPIILLIDRDSDVELIESCFGGPAPSNQALACLLDVNALGRDTVRVATRLLLGARPRAGSASAQGLAASSR